MASRTAHSTSHKKQAGSPEVHSMPEEGGICATGLLIGLQAFSIAREVSHEANY